MAEESAPQNQDLEPTAGEESEEPEEHRESPAAKPEEEPLAFVGIGASAGGLEALEQFFWHIRITSYNVCYTKLLRFRTRYIQSR